MINYCKNCKWEKDFKNCKNDYKNEMIKNKDGTIQCCYCAWFESIFIDIQ